jgi:hypothetical protein
MSNDPHIARQDGSEELPVVVEHELENEILRRIAEYREGRGKTVELDEFKKTLSKAARGSTAP